MAKLLEYPQIEVLESGHRQVLSDALNIYKGVLPLVDRYAGRSFCTPGKRLRLSDKDLFPKRLVDVNGNRIGIDEWWGCCTTPIVTGAIDNDTWLPPFREGEAHVITGGKLISLQELIEEDPKVIIGSRHEEITRKVFGKPTWGIVSKKFDNKNPIPYHWHWSKWEVYDINEYDNPGVHPSHYHTTAMGLYPWVTFEMLLKAMNNFGNPNGNAIRELAPHVFMPVGKGGFCMPNGVGHSPTDLCTHELHILMDEHFLAESLTLDGAISPNVAFLACREEDYPKSRHCDWEYLVSKVDFIANQDPNFVSRNNRPLIKAKKFCEDGVDASWVVYGNLLGEQKCSILRLILKPGAQCKLNFDSPSFFHTNKGEGQVGAYAVKFAREISLGTIYNQNGFITQSAIDDSSGVLFANSGTEDFVLTLDFPQDAHFELPGLS